MASLPQQPLTAKIWGGGGVVHPEPLLPGLVSEWNVDGLHFAQGTTTVVGSWEKWSCPERIVFFFAAHLPSSNSCILSASSSSMYPEPWSDLDVLFGIRPSAVTHPSLFGDKSVLLSWESPSRLSWLASKPQTSACFCFLSAGIRRTWHLLTWFLGVELRSSFLKDKHLTNWTNSSVSGWIFKYGIRQINILHRICILQDLGKLILFFIVYIAMIQWGSTGRWRTVLSPRRYL